MKQDRVAYESNQLQSDYYYYDGNGNLLYNPGSKAIDFLAENKKTNFSIGVSYMFGK